MKGTIGDWEHARFATEAEAEIAAVPTTNVELLEAATEVAWLPDDVELVALAGRRAGGLSVQLLVALTGDDSEARTFITIVDGAKSPRTIEVEPRLAWEAYEHPLVYSRGT